MNPDSPVHNLIFDVDGTLLDSKRDIAAAQIHALHALGVDHLTPEEIYPHIGKPLKETFSILLPASLHHRIGEATTVYRSYYLAHALDTTRPFEGVSGTLQSLRDLELKLAVATTKSTATTSKILEHFGLAAFFVHLQGSENIPFKPDPFILNKIIDEQRWDRARTVMVGDTDVDMTAARRAGIRTCGVTFGSCTKEQMTALRPDWIVESFTEILKVVGK